MRGPFTGLAQHLAHFFFDLFIRHRHVFGLCHPGQQKGTLEPSDGLILRLGPHLLGGLAQGAQIIVHPNVDLAQHPRLVVLNVLGLMLDHQRRELYLGAVYQRLQHRVSVASVGGLLGLGGELFVYLLTERIQALVSIADTFGELVVELGEDALFDLARRHGELYAFARDSLIHEVRRQLQCKLFG